MDYVQAETGLAGADQEFNIVSKEMQLAEMSEWSVKRRKNFLSAVKGAVPEFLHAAVARFLTKTGETFDPTGVKPGDVAKYCKGHPFMWSEDKVIEVAEKAGDWGKADTNDFFNDGETLYDRVTEVMIGYAESGFGTADPSPPEATVRALAARVEANIAEVEAVVLPAFSHLVLLLKVQAVVPKLDQADADKAARSNRLRRGKDGGYGATEDERKDSKDEDPIDDDNDEEGAGPVHHGLSIVDRVMGKQGGDHRPTNRHTRVDNFMLATGTDPKTRARVPKNHKLAVRASAEFINRVMSNGEIIIRDHFKPLCDRVFKPDTGIGGIAGVSSQHEQPLNSTAHTTLRYITAHNE